MRGRNGFVFEFVPVGNVMRVNAIDPITLTEVSMVAPLSASQQEMMVNAGNKLRYVIDKKRKEQQQTQQKEDLPNNGRIKPGQTGISFKV